MGKLIHQQLLLQLKFLSTSVQLFVQDRETLPLNFSLLMYFNIYLLAKKKKGIKMILL